MILKTGELWPTRRRGPKENGAYTYLDHYEPAPGQRGATLCGWEGGIPTKHIEGDGTPMCPDCDAIVRWAHSLSKRKERKKS